MTHQIVFCLVPLLRFCVQSSETTDSNKSAVHRKHLWQLRNVLASQKQVGIFVELPADSSFCSADWPLRLLPNYSPILYMATSSSNPKETTRIPQKSLSPPEMNLHPHLENRKSRPALDCFSARMRFHVFCLNSLQKDPGRCLFLESFKTCTPICPDEGRRVSRTSNIFSTHYHYQSHHTTDTISTSTNVISHHCRG